MNGWPSGDSSTCSECGCDMEPIGPPGVVHRAGCPRAPVYVEPVGWDAVNVDLWSHATGIHPRYECAWCGAREDCMTGTNPGALGWTCAGTQCWCSWCTSHGHAVPHRRET